MMSLIPEIPAAPFVPLYPALGSLNFNQEAYAYGTAMPGVTTRLREIAAACRECALAAREDAMSAEASRMQSAQQADQAMSYRNQAANSATAAAGSASTASTHASNAVGAYTQMQALYLGAKTSNPVKDNQGNALQLGAWYTYVGTDPALKGVWLWWDGAGWNPGIGPVVGTLMPKSGGKFTGYASGPEGATGEQFPQAQEVVPRAVAYFDKSTPMSAAPKGVVAFFESGDGGGTDWPYRTNVGIHGWMVETWDRGGSRSVQEATFTLSGFLSTYSKFRRYRHDANWSAWAREISDLDFRERVVTTNTGVGPGAAKLYFVDPKVGSIHHVIVEYNTHFAQALRDFGDQATLRMQFSGGAWPVSFGADIRFPVGVSMPTYTTGQIVTVTFVWTRAGYIDAFVAGVHTA